MKIYGESPEYLYYYDENDELIERNKITGEEKKQVYSVNVQGKTTGFAWETI